jgi:hypothetical protein
MGTYLGELMFPRSENVTATVAFLAPLRNAMEGDKQLLNSLVQCCERRRSRLALLGRPLTSASLLDSRLLAYAISVGSEEGVKLLLSARAFIAPAHRKHSFLEWAVQMGNIAIVKMLLEAGASTLGLAARKDQQDPFTMAVALGRVDLVDLLASYGAAQHTCGDLGLSRSIRWRCTPEFLRHLLDIAQRLNKDVPVVELLYKILGDNNLDRPDMPELRAVIATHPWTAPKMPKSSPFVP